MSVHVYLVPGFFGFSSIGSFEYFRSVRAVLGATLRARGIGARVVECSTQPTAFVKYRARHLCDQITAAGGTEASAIHLVGHSTGGLDVRRLLSPQGLYDDPVSCEPGEAIARRTRSAILISTPHRGTPLATFFANVGARDALRLLGRQASTRVRLAIFVAAKLLDVASRIDDLVGADREGVLGHFSAHLFRHLTLNPDDPFWIFLREVAADQGSIIQLTPEWMDHFNDVVTDRPGVAYRSIVTAAPAPLSHGLGRLLRRQPVPLAAAYVLLHTLVSRTPSAPSGGPVPRDVVAAIQRLLPFELDARVNDGIVPTLSQPYGGVLDVFVADHLDVVGQFERPGSTRYTDWLRSGSHFGQQRFERLWGRVARAIAEASA